MSHKDEVMHLVAIMSLCAALLAWPISSAAAARPNVVLILADDMGFSDPGCYGGEIQTPHLDRLAAEGVRFSQFYNCALCGPSRAALMTGLPPHRVGITRWTGLLNERCVTLFELLKPAGYATCAVGRLDMVTAETWHDPQNIARYVDRFFGTTGHQGPGNYFEDVRNTAFYRDGEPYSIPDGGYKTDLITDFATQFIREADSSQPFLLYMAHYAPHWPLHAKPEDIARYRDLYRMLGWDQVRASRLNRLIDSGVVPAGTHLAPRDERARPWEQAKSQDWEAERMAVYAAQIDCLDQNIGRVMQALHEKGVADNTLVLFLSDNGAADTSAGPLDKPNQTWRSDGVPTRVGNRPEIWPGAADTFVTAGPAWACAANTPFRGHKQGNFEGGIASPLIAWWPNGIRDRNRISPEMCHITDITATVLEVAGVDYPAEFAGRTPSPTTGRSLLPLLQGNDWEGQATLCWSTSGSRAVREGQWKLVSAPGGPWELYDLSRDRAEQNNVADANPQRVARMAKTFEDWKN
jgi:arylsulfatase A-like enzyme